MKRCQTFCGWLLSWNSQKHKLLIISAMQMYAWVDIIAASVD